MKLPRLALVLAAVLLFAKGEAADGQTGNDRRTLVVYFSCTNNTKTMAERIAKIADADTWRIVPVRAYTDTDLDASDPKARAIVEQEHESVRPDIKGRCADIGKYDTVFLGYPLWAGKAPRVIFTFLESHDLSGKTIIPFCTSRSKGIGSSDVPLQKEAKRAKWKRGLRLDTDYDEATLAAWVTRNLPQETPARL